MKNDPRAALIKEHSQFVAMAATTEPDPCVALSATVFAAAALAASSGVTLEDFKTAVDKASLIVYAAHQEMFN